METEKDRIVRICNSLDNDDVELAEAFVKDGVLMLRVKDWARKEGEGQRVHVTIGIPLDNAVLREG